ncbi:MAG: hypothetical protein NTY80_01765 [candidate division SR1 bacterium]|nr:hypothetical protein [candidate division SR1 bacterium]
MNNLPNELFNVFPERIATPEEYKKAIGDILSPKNADFSVKEKKHPNSAAQPNIAHIKPYFIPIPQRKDRQYLPDLDSRREQMEEKYDEGNYAGTIKDIKYIFTHYKDLLSFHDVVEIYLWIIDMKLNNLIQDDAINFDEMFLLLQHIYPYEQNLDSDQKHSFWTYAGNACFFKAEVDDEIKYYDAANKAFDKALEFSHTSGNPNSDKIITYLKSVSLFKLKAYDKSLRAINDFLDICGRDTKKNTHNDPNDKKILSAIFEYQGDIYKELKQIHEAIRSYENHLLFNPDDEYTKKLIRTLSEQLPE